MAAGLALGPALEIMIMLMFRTPSDPADAGLLAQSFTGPQSGHGVLELGLSVGPLEMVELSLRAAARRLYE